MIKFFILQLALSASTNLAWSKSFNSSYLATDMPEKWICQKAQNEWLCRSNKGQESKEAFIVFKSKLIGPSDTMASFEDYLKKPKNIKGKNKNLISSKVISVKKQNINNHLWIRGEHLAGEIENYYSNYLITTNGDLAILATFNAHQKKYPKYKKEFEQIISSFKLISNIATQKTSKPTNGLEASMKNPIQAPVIEDEFDETDHSFIPLIIANKYLLLFVIAGLFFALWFFTRKR